MNRGTKARNITGTVLFVSGLLGLIWCMLPAIYYSTVNVGNTTGILVFLLFSLWGIFFEPVGDFFVKNKKKKLWKAVFIFAGAAAAAVVLFVITETMCMFMAAHEEPEGTETVVVLGSYVMKSGPSKVTESRLDAAAEYLNAHPDAVCIVSGGQGKNEPWPEADAMKSYLVSVGIDEARIFKEDESDNTRENLKFSYDIIKENGFSEKIVIISNEFHLYRAGRIADRLSIEHTYYAAKTPWKMFSACYIRELYAILADWFVYS